MGADYYDAHQKRPVNYFERIRGSLDRYNKLARHLLHLLLALAILNSTYLLKIEE